jgi:hypothetical protein
MHPRQLVCLVGIAIMSSACSGTVPPGSSGASPADATVSASPIPASPAPSPSVAPSSAPSPGVVVNDAQLVWDAQGDAVMTDHAKAPGYLDMVGASVELRDGSFVFTQVLASGVPAAPELPTGVVALGWSFCVDLDPGQSLRGYPMKTVRMPCELIVHTRWDGKALAGMVFDRRPLANGNEVTTISLTPVTDESALSESVPSSLLGELSSFRWSAFTEELGELGTDIAHHVDAAGPGTWPAN